MPQPIDDDTALTMYPSPTLTSPPKQTNQRRARRGGARLRPALLHPLQVCVWEALLLLLLLLRMRLCLWPWGASARKPARACIRLASRQCPLISLPPLLSPAHTPRTTANPIQQQSPQQPLLLKPRGARGAREDQAAPPPRQDAAGVAAAAQSGRRRGRRGHGAPRQWAAAQARRCGGHGGGRVESSSGGHGGALVVGVCFVF